MVGQEGKNPVLDQTPDSSLREQHGEEDGREEINGSSRKNDAATVSGLHVLAEDVSIDGFLRGDQVPRITVSRALLALNSIGRFVLLLLLNFPGFEGNEERRSDESADYVVHGRITGEGSTAAVMTN